MRKTFNVLAFFIFSTGCTVEVLSEEKVCMYDYSSAHDEDTTWYGKISVGYAYSTKAGIQNPDPSEWDASIEGYDARLGGSPFIEVGFGRSFAYYLRGDIAYTFFETFHYEKFQTGISQTVGFTGDHRIRFFDLDHQNVMFNLALYPEKHLYFSWIGLDISPYIGLGVGAGFSRVSNFHTIAYENEVGSTTSLGLKTNKTSFAWQGFAGFRVHPCASFMNLDLGYRYYESGKFKGPSNIYVNTPYLEGASSYGKPFEGKLKTHQWVISFNFWF